MDIWKYVRTLDLDKCAEQFQHALPFPSICIDDFLNDSFAEKVAAAFPSYDEAQQLGRGFHAVNERVREVEGRAALTKLASAIGQPELLAPSRFVLYVLPCLRRLRVACARGGASPSRRRIRAPP